MRARIIRWMGLRPFQRHAVLSALTPAAAAGDDGAAAQLSEPLLAPEAAATGHAGDLEQGGQLHAGPAWSPAQHHAAGGQSSGAAGAGGSAPIDIAPGPPHGGEEAVRIRVSSMTSEISEADGGPPPGARAPAPSLRGAARGAGGGALPPRSRAQ